MAIKPAHSRENPLEATFLLLRGLRGEIHELREQLAEERRARICENKSFAVQLQDLRGAELQHHSEMLAMLEELRAEKTARIDRLEDFIENALKEKAVRFENIEAKVEVEITERKAVIQALNKRLGAEAAQWRVRSEKQDREVKENRRIADLAASGARHRHDELRLEVERIASLLRENTMARDPFRHFPPHGTMGSTGLPTMAFPTASPSLRTATPSPPLVNTAEGVRDLCLSGRGAHWDELLASLEPPCLPGCMPGLPGMYHAGAI